ncbi:hypothetical protein BC833DRAFT_590536 [Globomyces pollinis-pini]|nr:hypothetical protein BC833DRAFT_590536 [Globomyces pollinis-pini]
MASLVNSHSVSFLRWSLLGVGVWYGWNRQNYLTHHVKQRSLDHKRIHYEELVEEAKIAYDTKLQKEQAKIAKRDGLTTIDFNSYKFDGDAWANWAAKTAEEPPKKK